MAAFSHGPSIATAQAAGPEAPAPNSPNSPAANSQLYLPLLVNEGTFVATPDQPDPDPGDPIRATPQRSAPTPTGRNWAATRSAPTPRRCK
ncbi:MAG: hypothetical protein HC853_06810 [Anaerolineae bacterium]|nr:hypothetical protein [Anaerolineae bacterium]